MNLGDRPGDWLGYAPGESPIRPGGPNSPKKKKMNWRFAQDLQLSGEEQQPEAATAHPVPVDLSASEVSEEVEVIEEEDVIEKEDADEDGPVFEVVEYEDDDDDSEYEDEEVIEDSAGSNRSDGSDRTDDDSVFDPLPPPIEIPNALKPVDARVPDTKLVPSTTSKQQDDSSEDSSELSEDEGGEQTKREPVSSLRPQTLRGHSNDGMHDMSEHARRGKRTSSVNKETEGEDDEQQEIKEAPRVSPNSIRPAIIRGHSCEDEIQAMKEAVSSPRGGRRPGRHDHEDNEEIVTAPVISLLRPGTLRGHSFDNGTPEASKTGQRGGKRPDASKSAMNEQSPTDDPSTPARSAKPSYASLRNEAPMSPGRNSIPTSPRTPKSPSRRGEDIAPAAPSYTRVDNDGVEHKEYTWEKPAWAMKSPLKSTSKGDKLKQGSDIARPIGGIKPVP
jgi:hypothetical protein